MFDVPVAIIKKSKSPVDDYESTLGSFAAKRYFDGGVAALQVLEDAPAHLVVIETDTEDMTGLEIAEAIRDIDTEVDHFTYVVILGDLQSAELKDACEVFVDAHVSSSMRTTLSQVVTSGCRLSQQLNAVKSLNSRLTQSNVELQKGQLLDPVTGLGNRRFAEQSLNNSIRQIESRGGVACFLLISIQNHQEMIQNFDEKIANDLVQMVAEKIQHLVRPMDIVTYFEPGQFALVLIQPSMEQCTAECYQRIFDGVKLKRYRTAAGFLEANIAMSICASQAEYGPPNPRVMIQFAQENLARAFQEDCIIVHHLSSE